MFYASSNNFFLSRPATCLSTYTYAVREKRKIRHTHTKHTHSQITHITTTTTNNTYTSAVLTVCAFVEWWPTPVYTAPSCWPRRAGWTNCCSDIALRQALCTTCSTRSPNTCRTPKLTAMRNAETFFLFCCPCVCVWPITQLSLKRYSEDYDILS